MNSIETILLNNCDQMIWTVDGNLVLTTANTAFLNRMEVLAAGKLRIGDNVLREELFSESMLATWKSFYHQALSGQTVDQEMRTPATQEYSEAWVHFRLVPLWEGSAVNGVAGYGSSITDRKRAEDRLRGILNAVPDLVFEHTPDGLFLNYFASSPELLAAPPEAFLGKRVTDVLPHSVAQQFLGAYAEALAEQRAVVVEYSLNLGGRETFFFAKVAPCTSKTLITVTQDVTKERDNALQASRVRELDSLSILAQGTAKEFSEVLAVIARGLNALRTDTTNMGPLDTIEAASRRGTHVVGELNKVHQRRRSGATSSDWQSVLHPRIRALLVDDDEMDREIFGELLGVLGCDVTSAPRGERALEFLAQGKVFDFVLLDMNMPGLGGAATLKALRTTHPTLPVLVSTGLANQQVLDLISQTPYTELMSKPFELERLKAYLSRFSAKESGNRS